MTTSLNHELLDVFTWPNPKNPELNERRLLLRQTLESWVSEAWADLDGDMERRSTLTHPHQYNSFKVTSLRVLYGRAESDRKKLVQFFGVEFKDVISSPGRNIHVEARLDEGGLSCGLRIPSEAWWDFRALMDEGETGATDLHQIIAEALPGFSIESGTWPGEETCGRIEADQWLRLCKSLRPGEHDFVIRKRLMLADEPTDQLREHGNGLRSVYEALRWRT